MAITSIGYDGSVNEIQWAKLVPLAGSAHYGVSGSGDWKVTAHSTLDRGVIVATGSGWGHGVLDTSDATASLQGAAVGSGSRWDMIVARRNWGGVGGVTSFAIITGGTNRALPTRNTNPGTLDDQPLALVQFTAGQTSPSAIVDLRCWARNGGMTARDDLALTYLKLPGAQVMIGGSQWNCELDLNSNPSWTTFVSGRIPLFGSSAGALAGPSGANPGALITGGQQFLIQAGSTVNISDTSGYARVTFQKPFPNGLLTVFGLNGDEGSAGNLLYASAGAAWGAEGFGTTSSWVYSVMGASPTGPINRNGGINKIHRINWVAVGW